MHLAQSWENLPALGQVQGCDHTLLFEPLVDAELVANIPALEYEELLVELLVQLPLPLKGEVRRNDNENALGQTAEFELADQEASHDCLACARIIGEQKAHSRRLQEV